MPTGQDQPLQGTRVLIVEDEFFIADDLARALRRCGATPVGPVNSVEQADRFLEAEDIDAAILDLNLHGEMAFPLVERLSREKMPCLVVSGYGKETLPDSLKGVPHLEKPISAAAAITSLSEQLRGSLRP